VSLLNIPPRLFLDVSWFFFPAQKQEKQEKNEEKDEKEPDEQQSLMQKNGDKVSVKPIKDNAGIN